MLANDQHRSIRLPRGTYEVYDCISMEGGIELTTLVSTGVVPIVKVKTKSLGKE